MECKLIEVVADRLQGGERERYLPGWHPGFWTLPVPLLKVGREDPLMSGGTRVPREAQTGEEVYLAPPYWSTRFQRCGLG